MRGRLPAGLALILAVASCGGSTTGTSGEPDEASGGSATASGGRESSSGGSPPSAGGAPASGGRSAAGGAGVTVPDGGDALPPTIFVVNGWVYPAEHVTFMVEASQFIGGIDRWVFSFTWRYDDPASDDEERWLIAGLRLTILGSDPIGEAPVTYPVPDGSVQTPVELVSGTYYAWELEETAVNGISGYITVWREGDRFVGGVHLRLAPTAGDAVDIVASGPFDVPAP